MQHYAKRYLYDWKQAEDLVQDAFLSLWDHLERYDEKQPVFYYMLGIIRNNCLNYLRDLEIQGKHQDKIIEAMLFSGIEDPEIDEDIHERLKTILDTLPEKQKGSRITSYCREEKDQRNCNTDGYCRNYSEDSFQTGHGDIAE